MIFNPPKYSDQKQNNIYLAHLVLAAAGSNSVCIGGLEVVINLNVQVTAVLVVGLDVKFAVDLLSVLCGQDILDVENGLFPVSVLGVRAGREADGLVAGGEVDVEPRNESVDEVVSLGGQGEACVEGEVGGGAGVEIEGQNGDGVGNDSLEIDSIDQGFRESGVLQGSVVKAVHVIPDLYSCQTSEMWP